ncbi:HNH endonuclease signature motif containing protein [Pseudofrankia asymbiotica]|nr:HNH endonuclease signature motif containing protein [Pseudofrankia asymbiotica]
MEEPDAVSLDAVSSVAGLESGPLRWLAQADTSLEAVLAGLAGCAEEAAFDLVVELVRLASRLQGLTIRAQVHLARLRPAPSGDGDESGGAYSEFLADELAAELSQSPRTASGRLAQAWDIAHQVPDALDALTSGQLDYPRLLALHDVTRALSDGQRATVEAQMLAGGRLKSPSQWRRKLHRMVTRIDPDAAARRRKEAHAQRGVAVQALEDGMGLLSATLTAQDARAIFERIDRIAKADARVDGDGRPIDARRADVLAALLLGNRRELVKVEIQVIAAVGTLAGLDDNPAELVGHGPIPATVGRMLAADANWRRVLTDPDTGTVLDLGHRRIPTPALARLIRHRDTRCVFPGCGMPATCCDIDHTVAHATGGRTALDNLGLLCRHHHSAKHRGGWTLNQPEAGVFIWMSPAGRTYHLDINTNEEEGLLLPEGEKGDASSMQPCPRPHAESTVNGGRPKEIRVRSKIIGDPCRGHIGHPVADLAESVGHRWSVA